MADSDTPALGAVPIEDLAAQYFDEEQAPGLRADGMPEEGIAHLRQRYIRDAAANPDAVRELRDLFDAPATLEDAVRAELSMLWSDVSTARGQAINTDWSIKCANLASRIVTLSRFVGPTRWEEIGVSLLLGGVYQRVYDEAGIPYPPIDFDRVRAVQRRIDEGRNRDR